MEFHIRERLSPFILELSSDPSLQTPSICFGLDFLFSRLIILHVIIEMPPTSAIPILDFQGLNFQDKIS